MKKFRIAALAMASVIALSGCTLVSPDEERIANQVVATVNGAQIYKYEVDAVAQQYIMLYGIDPESEDEAVQAQYEEILNGIMDSHVRSEVMLQKGAELDIGLTDEQKQENRTEADEQFANIKSGIRTTVEEEAKDDSTMDVDAEVEKRYEAYLEDSGATPDSYYEDLNEQDLITEVQNYVYGLAEVTDDEVRDWYDRSLQAQKDEMADNPQAFAAYVQQENIYVNIPEDTVAVKQVLLKLKDEALAEEA
ncbi:MAG: hypothetical protein MI741_19615, partial [Rhodospirillales bacterium]|nr:hypothetical protein [Rhodospirillales bacterium]